jgi:3-hydroxyisobutyrate dehydrogenase-like beta-hydroxyacid dehydrogenase
VINHFLTKQKSNMKKIGILGSGIVGQTLANGFIKYGYEVMMGTSDPSKLAEWKAKAGEHGSVGSFADAAAYGELVVLAVKGTAAIKAIEKAGASHFEGKTHHVHMREQRSIKRRSETDPEPVRLGNGGHGKGRSCKSH